MFVVAVVASGATNYQIPMGVATLEIVVGLAY